MSDTMLLGVLRMPPEMWADSELDRIQRHDRYLEAANRIEAEDALRQQAREEALEEAARVCEERAGTVSMFATSRDARDHNATVRGCAAAIRGLIQKEGVNA